MRSLTRGKKFRVWIEGVSDKVSPKFAYTIAGSKNKALINTLHRIVKEVQAAISPYSKDWHFEHDKFRVKMSPAYVSLLLEYLFANPKLFKVEEMG